VEDWLKKCIFVPFLTEVNFILNAKMIMKREDLLTGKTEMRASESASEYNFNGWLLDYIDRNA